MHHQEFIEVSALLHFVRTTPDHRLKALCCLAKVPMELAQQIQMLTGVTVEDYTVTVDSSGLRHALTGHSQERGSKDQYPLLEADILALPAWVTVSPVVEPGSAPKNALQPRRLRLERPELFRALKTVVILEVRTGRKQLALVTMYKTING